MVFGDDLGFDDVGIGLLTILQERQNISGFFHLLPIDIRIATRNANLMFAVAIQVDLADSAVEGFIDRRRRTDRSYRVAPGTLNVVIGMPSPRT
jgi:hypothetical protein